MIIPNTSPGKDSDVSCIKISLQYNYADSVKRVDVVVKEHIKSMEWVQISGDFQVENDHNRTLKQLQLYVHGPPPGVEFITDSVHMSIISLDKNWRTKAQDRIDTARKNSLTVNVKAFSQDFQNLTIELRQIESQFGLGTMVDGFLLQTNKDYRDWFLANFDWVTLRSDMDWRRTEYSKYRLTWEETDAVMAILEKHHKRIRGHMIHSSMKEDNPDWVQELECPDDLYRACMKRVDDLVTKFRYRCQAWDVVREMSGEQFLSDIYGSAKIHHDLYKRTKEVDYAAQLFLSENNLLSSSKNIQNVLDQVEDMDRHGAPVDGISAQANFNNSISHPSLLLDRIDRLAVSNLSLWITEYHLSNADPQMSSLALDDIITVLLSHGSVDGFMFGAFWEGDSPRKTGAALADKNFQDTEVGMKWKKIFLELARFSENITPFNLVKHRSTNTFTRKLYHGIYEATVYSGDGIKLTKKNIPLLRHQGDKEVTIWV